MEQININTAPTEAVEEEMVEERADGSVVRRRVVNREQPPVVETEGAEVNVNVPDGGRQTGSTNINITT